MHQVKKHIFSFLCIDKILKMEQQKPQRKWKIFELREKIVTEELIIIVKYIKDGKNGSRRINCGNKFEKDKTADEFQSVLANN